MVVFTCSHCGDSIQKPRVEKHYQTTCRRNPISLTCVDCLKDFKLEEYVAHTKCVTEAERYSKKGTVQNGHKGDAKQSSWVAAVQALIEECRNTKPHLQNVLELVSKYDNIPKKKKKFVNFAQSSFGKNANSNEINEVWDLLEERLNSMKNEVPVVEKNESKKNKRKAEESKVEEEKENTVVEKSELPKKKKKKTKTTDETKEIEENSNVNESDKKSKKKKSKKLAEENNTVEESKTENVTQENGINKKQKKNKSQNQLDETNGIEEETTTKKKSKKNKSKKSTDTTLSGENSEKNETKEEKPETSPKQNGMNKKSKNKKAAKTGTEEKSTDETKSKKQKFKWSEMITQTLSKYSDGLTKQVLWKKLSKKFVATQGSMECEQKVLHTFHTKLKRILNTKVTLDKSSDMVKLVKE